MTEEKGVIAEIVGSLWEVWKEMFSLLISIIPKVVSFFFWVICGIIILPCVFISGNLYPKWVEWGEKF